MSPALILEPCNCYQCVDSESPCVGNCPSDDRCAGCIELNLNDVELAYEIDCALGRV